MRQALLLDLNGVLFEDGVALSGAVEAVARARAEGLILRFVTNTATRSARTLLAELRGMGFELADEELFTAPMAARAYLQRHGLRPHCLVHPAIAATFEDLLGPEPDAVVLGDARDGLSYAALNQVFRLVRTGLPLIGLGMNRCFREGGEWMLDAGPFILAIAWAADTEAVVMGKPSVAFYEELVASTGLEPGACLMVGDDVEADVGGAMACGLRGCLVRSGKFQPGDLKRLPAGAAVIGSLAELPPLLG
jgi:HAD superfamily hydrolase (TIGR01458 family)